MMRTSPSTADIELTALARAVLAARTMVGATNRRAGALLVLRAMTRRIVLLAATWWALTGGEPSAVGVGMVALVVAMIVSARLSGPLDMKVSLVGLLALTWWFVVGSLRGGWDVAWRALARRMPLEPCVIRHRTQLAPGAQRRIFSVINTLMPGSLSIDSSDADPELTIHVLIDRGDAFDRELRLLESRVARAFQVPSTDLGTGR